MEITSVTVDGFRNLTGTLSAAPGLNVLWGGNGQGKTNWLEAIYLLATTKSFRTHQPQELMAFGAAAAHLRLEVQRRTGSPVTLDMHLEAGRKVMLVNGKRAALRDYLDNSWCLPTGARRWMSSAGSRSSAGGFSTGAS